MDPSSRLKDRAEAAGLHRTASSSHLPATVEHFADGTCEHSWPAHPKQEKGWHKPWALTDILYVFFMDMMLAGRVHALNRRVAHAIVSHLHKQGLRGSVQLAGSAQGTDGQCHMSAFSAAEG